MESQVSNRLLDYSPDRRIVGEGRAGGQSRVGGVESNPSRAESPGYFVTIENSESDKLIGEVCGPSSLESLSVGPATSYRPA